MFYFCIRNKMTFEDQNSYIFRERDKVPDLRFSHKFKKLILN